MRGVGDSRRNLVIELSDFENERMVGEPENYSFSFKTTPSDTYLMEICICSTSSLLPYRLSVPEVLTST